MNNHRTSVAVNEVKQTQHTSQAQYKKPHRNQYTNNNNAKPTRGQESSNNQHTTPSDIVNCKYCSFTHPRKMCPAFGKTCNLCSKKNHFATVCKSKNVALVNVDNSERSSEYDFNDNSEFFVSIVENNSNEAEPTMENVALSNVNNFEYNQEYDFDDIS